jgi:hypothetical protein
MGVGRGVLAIFRPAAEAADVEERTSRGRSGTKALSLFSKTSAWLYLQQIKHP